MTKTYGPPSEVVGERVKQARKRRGWKATQLAERCAEVGASDLTAQAIANIENGRKDRETQRRRRHVTVDELLALALALDVAPVHLLTPLDEGGYWVTKTRGIKVGLVRHWIRGTEPPPKGDRRVFFSEVPEQEFEMPTPTGQDTNAEFLQRPADAEA